MIRVSCSVKTHAFHLAEQLERKHILDKLYSIYHSGKNPIVAKFNKRRDAEKILLTHIQTFPFLAPLSRIRKDPYPNNVLYDRCVSRALKSDTDYKAFIGWSGMSLRSIQQAKKDGKKTLVERGSSHIEFQYSLLTEEYATWGFEFQQHHNILGQELREYELADCIVVPSGFVEKTFLDKGIPKEKLFRNNFGVNSLFTPTQPKRDKFTVLYVGNLSIRKGIPYLFQALSLLDMDPACYDVWFVGSVRPEIEQMIPKFEKPNWKFFGHINHHQLADVLSACSVAVHPSLEEGLSMVIPQLMASGTPVIATTNTGAEDIIQDGKNGYIIPIRSPQAIAEKLTHLYHHRDELSAVRNSALAHVQQVGTWDQYGDRYFQFINALLTE